MKHIISVLAFAAAVILSASCSKETLPADEIANPSVEDGAKVYDLALAFDAPASLAEATVYFFDQHGQQLAVSSIDVPASSAETVCASFLAEAEPEYILTEGLQNTGDNGLLRIQKSSVTTRSAMMDVTLLVIR